MLSEIDLSNIYIKSEDVIVREISGELIIVPIASGIGDMEGELYSMNETGKAILDKLNGKKSLNQIAEELAVEYQAPLTEIRQDVLGLVNELIKRRMLKIVK